MRHPRAHARDVLNASASSTINHRPMVLMEKDARIAHFFSESRKLRAHSLLVQYPFNFYAVPTTCFTMGIHC
jgi:hypothetical protein